LCLFPAQPGTLHFSSSNFLATQELHFFPGLHPGHPPACPSTHPQTLARVFQAPCCLALSNPAWGSAQISNYKYPLCVLAHTRWPLSTVKGGLACSHGSRGRLFTQGWLHPLPHAAGRHTTSQAGQAHASHRSRVGAENRRIGSGQAYRQAVPVHLLTSQVLMSLGVCVRLVPGLPWTPESVDT
jgi:hypothetical protein